MNNPNDMLPEGISIESQGDTRIVRYRWYSNFYIPLFIFFMIWDGVLLYDFIQAFANHAPNILGTALCALPHTLVGLFMTYYLIAILVNETVIELGDHELKLVHTPLPWSGNHQKINIFDIQSIECERGRGSRHSPSTDIVLYLNNGQRQKLVSSIQNRETAHCIRDQIRDFRNRYLHVDVSPSQLSGLVRTRDAGDLLIDRRPRRGFRNVFSVIILLTLLVSTLLLVFAFRSLMNPPGMISPGSYESIEVWDLQGDDTVRYTVLDTYPDATPKRRNWCSLPLMWKDTDIASFALIGGTLIEPRVSDVPYRDQTYRYHSYLMESDQREFGCSATLTGLPHLHITGASSRLISIGLDPSSTVDARTRSVIVVILPDGAGGIAVTDMQPYRTLTQNARMLYYYDVKSVTTHESIHIAYTLTGIPTTGINMDAVIKNSKP